ncbi:tetranectin-like [Hypanus sabinus]|uniref:tetranectin-like n=1 Tax=Hypanus sabinus TaxID=79690 RepID=UPI0028C3FF20|nr:tetranectin-like [Hypanus sabinus]
MQLRAVVSLFTVLCLLRLSRQQPMKTVSAKRVTVGMIEDIKKQIDHIMEEVNLLKEKQALHTVCFRGMKVDNKCYLPMIGVKTFHMASDDCILHGGTLGWAKDEEENQALFEYARQKVGENRNIWIGVMDMMMEGTWVDMTGTLVNYTNWETLASQQPDGGTKENCVALSGLANGKWLDEPCHLQYNYFCQFNIL